MENKTVVAILITFVITMFVCYSLTQDLRKELRALRAEHEAIEQNYCPTCGAYLGGVEDG
ncbi:MAG: hypothetical protein IKR19_07705 [Acholeplasmatales bacterium]|nr:hypothetical protein [Acholeplasmatales bacterium]